MRTTVVDDIRKAALAGPFRVGLPLLGYAVLYPILIDGYGLAVVGLWSIFATISATIVLFDAGLGGYITRKVSLARNQDELEASNLEYLLSMKTYFIGLAIGLGLFVSAVYAVEAVFDPSIPYDPVRFHWSLIIFYMAISVGLTNKLMEAVLAGSGDNAFLQWATGLKQLAVIFAAIAGAFLGVPIEAYVLGAVLAEFALRQSFISRIRRTVPSWKFETSLMSWGQWRAGVRRMLREAFFLYSLSLAQMARNPLLRAAIIATFPLSEVGVFDIAFRLAFSLHQILTAGLNALFPNFSRLVSFGETELLQKVFRAAMLLVGLVGGLFMSFLIYVIPWLYIFWLGDAGPGLVNVTRILLLWFIANMVLLAPWHLIKSYKLEKALVVTLLVHGLSAIPLVLVVADTTSLAAAWAGVGVLIYLVLYLAMQRHIEILRAQAGMVTLVAGASLLLPLAFVIATVFYTVPGIWLVLAIWFAQLAAAALLLGRNWSVIQILLKGSLPSPANPGDARQ